MELECAIGGSCKYAREVANTADLKRLSLTAGIRSFITGKARRIPFNRRMLVWISAFVGDT